MALTTAYAGHGDTTPDNVPAVLDTFLPQDLGMVYIPTRVPRFQAGLKKVVTWLEGEVGKEGTIPVDDLVQALLDRRETEGDDVALVLLYAPDKEDDVALAKRAIEAGIRVVDFCQAGDDLLLSDSEVTFEEAPADEPAEETPPFEPDPPKETPATSPADAVAKAAAAGQAAAEAVMASRPVPAQPAPGVAIQFTVNLDPAAIQELAKAIVAAMGATAQTQLSLVESGPDATVHDLPTGKPATDEQPEGTKPYYYDRENDKYRPARGMARKSEQKVFLDPREVAAIKASGMLS